MKTRETPLMVILLCAACASHHLPPKELLEADIEAMQEAVAAKISDAPRAARLNSSISELRQQLLAFQAECDRFQYDLLVLNARPDATRAQLEARIEQLDKQRAATRTRVFEVHSAMLAATTPEEWKGLFPYERALLTDSGH
jgi:septal ring factor EnvC (AmiA/AmiB activator)